MEVLEFVGGTHGSIRVAIYLHTPCASVARTWCVCSVLIKTNSSSGPYSSFSPWNKGVWDSMLMAHSLHKVYNSPHTFCLDLILPCATFSSAVVQGQSTNVNKSWV